MKTIFVLAAIRSLDQQSQIYEESQVHHDIIQLDFLDSYLNLTLKTLSILHWTKYFCPKAKWILKSDEDVFVDPFTLKKIVGWNRWANYICKLNEDLTVCRPGQSCKEKWYIPYEMYPYEEYPRYCNGPAYIISSNMARNIYRVANKIQPYLMEDAYYTGILPLNFKPKYAGLSWWNFPAYSYVKKDFFKLGTTMLVLDLEYRNSSSYKVWNDVLQYYKITTWG